MIDIDQEVYEIEAVKVLRRTPRAIMIRTQGVTLWVPRSVIAEHHQSSLLVRFWWMEKSGALMKIEAARDPFEPCGDTSIKDLEAGLSAGLAA